MVRGFAHLFAHEGEVRLTLTQRAPSACHGRRVVMHMHVAMHM